MHGRGNGDGSFHLTHTQGWSFFSVPIRYPLDTLIGARSTPILRHKLKHGTKDDFTMQAGACGEKDL